MRLALCLLGLLALSCSNAVTATRASLEDLRGHHGDDVIRALGRPSGGWRLPESRHVVLIYDAQRVHKGSVVGTILSGMGSGMTGRAPAVSGPHAISCRFELEFDDQDRLVGVTERGEGC